MGQVLTITGREGTLLLWHKHQKGDSIPPVKVGEPLNCTHPTTSKAQTAIGTLRPSGELMPAGGAGVICGQGIKNRIITALGY